MGCLSSIGTGSGNGEGPGQSNSSIGWEKVFGEKCPFLHVLGVIIRGEEPSRGPVHFFTWNHLFLPPFPHHGGPFSLDLISAATLDQVSSLWGSYLRAPERQPSHGESGPWELILERECGPSPVHPRPGSSSRLPWTSTYPRLSTRGSHCPLQEHLQGHPSLPTQAVVGSPLPALLSLSWCHSCFRPRRWGHGAGRSGAASAWPPNASLCAPPEPLRSLSLSWDRASPFSGSLRCPCGSCARFQRH